MSIEIHKQQDVENQKRPLFAHLNQLLSANQQDIRDVLKTFLTEYKGKEQILNDIYSSKTKSTEKDSTVTHLFCVLQTMLRGKLQLVFFAI